MNGEDEKKIMVKAVLNLKEKLKEDLPEMHQEKVDPTIGGMDDILIAQNDMVIEIDSELLLENSENGEDEMNFIMKAVLNLKPKTLTTDTNNTKRFTKCPECDMSLNNLSIHMRSVHEKELRYACNVCNNISLFKSNLTKHQTNCHGVEDSSSNFLKLDSNKCAKGEIHEHKQGKEKTIKRCDKCDFETYKRKYLVNHERFSHNSNYAVLKCEKCEFETNRKTLLQTHTRSIYKCSECDFKSHHKNIVNRHLNIHNKTGLTRILGIGCEMCEDGEVHKNCLFEIDLRTQGKKIRQNDIDRVFKCDICDYEGKKNVYLQMHRKSIHGKIVRYSCSNCDMKSFYKHNVHSHIRSNHKNSAAKVFGIGCGTCITGEHHAICFVKSTNKVNHATTNKRRQSPQLMICDYVHLLPWPIEN